MSSCVIYSWGETRRTELLDFASAYDRYGLQALGVTKVDWKDSLKSEIEDSRDNIVRRAALRTAARHLRPLGYGKEFSRADANTGEPAATRASGFQCIERRGY